MGTRMKPRFLLLILLVLNLGAAARPKNKPSRPTIYTILQQEPPADVPYPQAFFSKKLPHAGQGGPVSHLMRNSDLIVNEMMTKGWQRCRGCGASHLPRIGGASYWSSPGANDGGANALYYASSSDPLYRIAFCQHDPAHATGKVFHAPSAAEYSGNCSGIWPCDTFDAKIEIWDQAQDIIFGAYGGNGRIQSLPACQAQQASQACPLHLTYCSWASRSQSPGFNGGSAYATNGMPPAAGGIRMLEEQTGQIHHAIYLETLCTDESTVFPATHGGYTAQTCATLKSHADPSFSYSFRPPNGSLVFLDYTDTDLASLKSRLPAWQYPIIEALTYYGGYIGDTGSYGGLYLGRVESGQPYRYYEQHGFPGAYRKAQQFYRWLGQNCNTGACHHGTHANSPPYSADVYTLYPFDGIPRVHGRDILGHMHIADPCVAKGLANLGRGCSRGKPESHSERKLRPQP